METHWLNLHWIPHKVQYLFALAFLFAFLDSAFVCSLSIFLVFLDLFLLIFESFIYYSSIGSGTILNPGIFFFFVDEHLWNHQYFSLGTNFQVKNQYHKTVIYNFSLIKLADKKNTE